MNGMVKINGISADDWIINGFICLKSLIWPQTKGKKVSAKIIVDMPTIIMVCFKDNIFLFNPKRKAIMKGIMKTFLVEILSPIRVPIKI